MFAFYAVRGHALDELASCGYYERAFLHRAREAYYKEETEKFKALFGGKGD